MNTSNFGSMGKEALRAACKAAAVKGWGKMNNTQMREALVAQADRKEHSDSVKAVVRNSDTKGSQETLADSIKEAIEQGSTTEHAEVSKLTEQFPVEDSRKDLTKEVPVLPVKSKSAGTKIQKDRAEQNGVKRPSEGTICAAIWAQLDTKRAELNATPSFKDLKALQDKFGWQRNTAVTQYQRWKEFNDLMVR
jgi:hypothetical protein